MENPEQSARCLKHSSQGKAWEYILDSIKKPGKLSVPPQAKEQKTAQLGLWPGLPAVRLCTANQRDAGTLQWSAFKHKAGHSVGLECSRVVAKSLVSETHLQTLDREPIVSVSSSNRWENTQFPRIL